MNTEQERAAFDAWLGIKPCGSAHDFGWEAWRARAALQSQDRGTVIEEGFRWRSINPPYKIWNYVWDRAPDSWELREAEIQNVVVYARRVEGEGE